MHCIRLEKYRKVIDDLAIGVQFRFGVLCRFWRREICKSRLPLKIFSFSSSLHDCISSMKSGGSVLTIFSKCANLASEIFSSLRAFAQVIRPGPLLIKAWILRPS